MTRPQKLELTWVGKDERPRLEPRILVEDAALSYHAPSRVTANDRFDNLLIQGDNLLALKALEQEYAGQVKCVFIDPPYNTGQAFEHYEDGLEHSLWLSLMRARFEHLKHLLHDDGTLWVILDDSESHYCKVMLDEIFGRSSFVANIVWRSTDNSNNDAKTFSVDHNHILVYAKSLDWRSKRLVPTPDQVKHFSNPDDDPNGPWFDGNPLGSPKPRKNLMFSIESPTGHQIPHPPNGWRWSPETVADKITSGEIRFTPDGKAIRRRTYLKDHKGLPPSTLWIRLEQYGHNRQAKYEQIAIFDDERIAPFTTPKPERLIAQVLEIATNPGDLVLDSFLGSGTTAAVAHKMGRRWIGIELGDHAVTHCVPRLRKVVDGKDPGGITAQTNWKGGGGFRFCRLAPSLLEKDHWGNWVVSREYNGAMLAEALCKLHGFRYEPNAEVFWQQGRSTERDFLYATTQTLDSAQLEWLSEQVGAERSLLVLCRAWIGNADRWPNLTLQKVPNAVLGRCEFGRDDYSLRVAALPAAPAAADADAPDDIATIASAPTRPAGKRGKRKASPDQPSLLDDGHTGDAS